MILSTKAIYLGTGDLVEVSSFMREDDGTTSIHKKIKSGKLLLLHNKTPISTIEFDGTIYNEEREGFSFFFLHPPLQTNMNVRLEVELFDGKTGVDRAIVQPSELLNDVDQFQNPSLPGRAIPDYTEIPAYQEKNSGFELL